MGRYLEAAKVVRAAMDAAAAALTDDEKAQWVEAAQKFFDEASSTLGWTEGLYDTVKGISTGAAA